MQQIKTALLSFGMSGKVFHAPFIELHPGFQLLGAWERTNKNIQQVYLHAKSYPSLEEILNDKEVELVIVNTPTFTHYEYAKQALLAGKHIIVEKAFTTTVKEAEELKALSIKQNKKTGVYQNRRYDSDFKTVQKIVQQGLVGNINEVEIHFDRFKPTLSPKQHKELPGPGAGILKDLGAHIIDQALCLFGMPIAVFADIRITRDLSQVDDDINLLLYYSTFRVRLKAGYLVRETLPAFILHGHSGSFLKSRADVQEANLVAGIKPNTLNWGAEPVEESGLLHIETGDKIIYEKITTARGNYYEYYDAVYKALTSANAMPVTVDDGINVMRIIEAAIQSNKEGNVVKL
jgi:scyllo-inositol 2-dehydrogenase (NADP+)